MDDCEMKLPKRNEYGELVCPEGTTYDSIMEWLTDKLGFCGCMDPDGVALRYVLPRLKAVRNNEFEVRDDGDAFFIYWCDYHQLVEHGSSLAVGGWLTEKGNQVLKLLQDEALQRLTDIEEEMGLGDEDVQR